MIGKSAKYLNEKYNKMKNLVKYLKRYLDKDLEFYLNTIGVILIIGPKWCGKTTTAEQFSNNSVKLQDKYKSLNYQKIIEINPYKLLEGSKLRLI